MKVLNLEDCVLGFSMLVSCYIRAALENIFFKNSSMMPFEFCIFNSIELLTIILYLSDAGRQI